MTVMGCVVARATGLDGHHGIRGDLTARRVVIVVLEQRPAKPDEVKRLGGAPSPCDSPDGQRNARGRRGSGRPRELARPFHDEDTTVQITTV
jgi:hypothetical protein